MAERKNDKSYPDKNYKSHESLIKEAKEGASRACYTEPDADSYCFLGIDDLDRLRRDKLK